MSLYSYSKAILTLSCPQPSILAMDPGSALDCDNQMVYNFRSARS